MRLMAFVLLLQALAAPDPAQAHYMTLGPAAEIYVADTVNATLHKFVKK